MSADRAPEHLRHVLLCFSRYPRHACMRPHLSHSSTIQQHMVHRQKTSSRLPHQQTHTIRPAPSWRSKPRDLLARPLAQQSQPPSRTSPKVQSASALPAKPYQWSCVVSHTCTDGPIKSVPWTCLVCPARSALAAGCMRVQTHNRTHRSLARAHHRLQSSRSQHRTQCSSKHPALLQKAHHIKPMVSWTAARPNGSA